MLTESIASNESILTKGMFQEFKTDFPYLWNAFDHLFSYDLVDDLYIIRRLDSTRSIDIQTFLIDCLNCHHDLIKLKDLNGAWLIREVIDDIIFLTR